MSTAVTSVPREERRVTPQMLLFAALVLGLLALIFYPFIEESITGGIKNIGNGVKQVNLQAMSTFAFDQERGSIEDIPEKWRALDGQRVVLYCEIYEPLEAGGGTLTGFDLCYSIAKCCFSGPPQVQHFVKARVVPGRELYHHPNQVKVTGTLHVNVVFDKEAGKVASVYQMDVEDIEPVR